MQRMKSNIKKKEIQRNCFITLQRRKKQKFTYKEHRSPASTNDPYVIWKKCMHTWANPMIAHETKV